MVLRVLVPLDGSRWSDAALEAALGVATAARAAGETTDLSLDLLHVVSATALTGDLARDLAGLLGVEPVVVPRAIEEALRRNGRKVLNRAAQRCEAAGVAHTQQLEVGAVVDVVVKRSAEATLVVMGSRGETEARQPGTGGGTAERILKRLHAAALVVSTAPRTFDRIAVGVDGSDGSLAALTEAGNLARAVGGAVVGIHVADGSGTGPLEQAQARVQVPFETRVTQGVVHEALPAAARDARCEVLAIGYRGHSQLKDWLLGRTTEWLVGRTELALLIAR